MHTEPLSILLPVRNGERCVGLALSDLTRGLSSTDEVVVVEDGSTDRTGEVVESWVERDSRIRVLRTAGMGLVQALNLGMREALHPWIARADADDRYPVERFARQRQAVSGSVALVTGDYRVCSPGTAPTYIACALGHPFVAASLINPQRIPHPGVLLRKEAVLAAGGYQESDFPAEDLALWLRMSEWGTFVGVPGRVVDWTMNPGSVTHTRQVDQRRKTSQLLASFRPSFLDDITPDSIDEELCRYSAASFAQERSLLLLRDLRAWKRHGHPTGGESTVMRGLARRPWESASAAWQLTREARRRRRGRRGVVGAYGRG